MQSKRRRRRRRRLLVAFALPVLLALGAAPVGLAANGFADPPAWHIPHLRGIRIDGAGDDWGDAGFRVDVIADAAGVVRQPANFDPTFRLAWDDAGLLFLACVIDDAPDEHDHPRNLYLGDSIELFVAPRVGAPAYYMVVISPGIDPRHPRVRHTFYDERDGRPVAGAGHELAVERECQRVTGGYCLKMRLPWRNLEIAAAEGSEIAFQLYAMDRDRGGETYQAAWFPALDTHLNRTTSMYPLRLGRIATEPVRAAVRARHRTIEVVGSPDAAGTPVKVLEADGQLAATGTLVPKDGRGALTLRLPKPPAGREVASLDVYLGDHLLARTARPQPEAMVADGMAAGRLTFFQHVFSGVRFPKVEFANGVPAEELLGSYRINPRFFDESFKEVTEARKPGRYGAVVEVIPERGRTSRRFATLYRTPDDRPVANLAVPARLATVTLPGKLTLGPADSGAGLSELDARLRAAGVTSPSDRASADTLQAANLADEQWWVRFKRHFYGLDQTPPAMPLPHPLPDGQTAPELRPGSPEEAGLSPEVCEQLDKICQEWLRVDKGEGFAICASRNGVVFFSRGYGNAGGRAMTERTPCPITSLTKLFTGVVVMMYADRGLVDLDAPIDRYVPALRGEGPRRPFTVRSLLTHTSGLVGHFGDNLRDLEEVIADRYSLTITPVEHVYNGVGFALAVKALETVSQRPLVALYRELLLDPLGCADTTIPDAHGGGKASAADLAKLGQMLLNGGAYGPTRFLSPRAVDLAKPTRLTMILGEETSQAWGIGFYGPRPRHRFGDDVFGHPSLNSSQLRVYPKTGVVIAVSAWEKNIAFTGELRDRFVSAVEAAIRAPNGHPAPAAGNPPAALVQEAP